MLKRKKKKFNTNRYFKTFKAKLKQVGQCN